MNKLEKRRHVYITQSELNDSIMVAIEEIDNYLEESFNLETLSSDIILYFSDAGNVMLGREVVGTDSQIKHHPKISVKDYDSISFDFSEIEITSLENLIMQIDSQSLGPCRVVIKNKNLFSASIYSFKSLEK
jgi:hypothetical protein